MKRFLVPLLVLATAACAAGKGDDEGDDAVARAGKASGAPGLMGPAAGAKDRVKDFVAWAAKSTPADKPEVRRALGEARNDAAIAAALADHASEVQDHSEALVALALLGEMRSPNAEAHLKRVIDKPLPPQAMGGGENEGDARSDQEMLQAKAVDGLAYLRSPSADNEVLRIAGHHESKLVRSEAIDAYLYNHGDSDEARAALSAVISQADQIFLDRPRYVEGETAEQFDAKLAKFLAKHPEVTNPPLPEKREEGAQ